MPLGMNLCDEPIVSGSVTAVGSSRGLNPTELF
jgi:hypothetical protein